MTDAADLGRLLSTGLDSAQGSGLGLQKAVVVTSTPLTVKVAGSSTIVSADALGTYDNRYVGDVVWCLVQPGLVLVIGSAGPRLPMSRYFAESVDNITTAPTVWASHTNLGVAPCYLSMLIITYGWAGFNGAANEISIVTRDNSGTPQWVNIGAASILTIDNNPAALWRPFTMIGRIDYATGATMGFDLAVVGLTGSNWYVRSGTVVQFLPYKDG